MTPDVLWVLAIGALFGLLLLLAACAAPDVLVCPMCYMNPGHVAECQSNYVAATCP